VLTSRPLLSRQRVSVFFAQFVLRRLARALVSAARLCVLSSGLRRFASEAQSVALSEGSVGSTLDFVEGYWAGMEVSEGHDQAAG
jgi:hypothetical protein